LDAKNLIISFFGGNEAAGMSMHCDERNGFVDILAVTKQEHPPPQELEIIQNLEVIRASLQQPSKVRRIGCKSSNRHVRQHIVEQSLDCDKVFITVIFHE
jgi:hypothetical protein